MIVTNICFMNEYEETDELITAPRSSIYLWGKGVDANLIGLWLGGDLQVTLEFLPVGV